MMMEIRLVLDVDVRTWALMEGASDLTEIERDVRGRVVSGLVAGQVSGDLPGVTLIRAAGGGVEP
jgi:hypothetical protein